MNEEDFSLTPSESARLWAKVDKTPRHGPWGDCWVWTAATMPFGHGLFRLRGKLPHAHRLSWVVANGPVPGGLFCLHRCDVPACVRPDHMWLGTRAQNNADRDAKGRHRAVRGYDHPALKLSPEQVLQMRAEYAGGGVSQRQMAVKFGVCQRTVCRILRGETYTADDLVKGSM